MSDTKEVESSVGIIMDAIAKYCTVNDYTNFHKQVRRAFYLHQIEFERAVELGYVTEYGQDTGKIYRDYYYGKEEEDYERED